MNKRQKIVFNPKLNLRETILTFFDVGRLLMCQTRYGIPSSVREQKSALRKLNKK